MEVRVMGDWRCKYVGADALLVAVVSASEVRMLVTSVGWTILCPVEIAVVERLVGRCCPVESGENS